MSHLFLNWNMLDYILAIVMLVSVVLCFFRGFVREVISLVTWFLAFYLALKLSPAVSGSLHTFISNPKAAYILSVILIFVVVMILGSIVKKLASGFVKMTFLGFFDKILGIIFGFARGILFVAIILFIIQLTPYHDAAWVKSSQLAPHFQGVMARVNALIPADITTPISSLKAHLNSISQSLLLPTKK